MHATTGAATIADKDVAVQRCDRKQLALHNDILHDACPADLGD